MDGKDRETNLKELHDEMTGGNVYTYWGRIDAERWFCYSSLGEVGIYNADINIAMEKELYGDDEDWDFYDWNKEHLIKECNEDDEEIAWLMKTIRKAFNIKN